VSSASPLNSSSKVHCQLPEGAATGGVEPEHWAAGSDPVEVVVVLVPTPNPVPAPAPVPVSMLLAPGRPAELVVVVLNGVGSP
jgi:hypothetical protein